jgi:hypothetical protein
MPVSPCAICFTAGQGDWADSELDGLDALLICWIRVKGASQ